MTSKYILNKKYDDYSCVSFINLYICTNSTRIIIMYSHTSSKSVRATNREVAAFIDYNILLSNATLTDPRTHQFFVAVTIHRYCRLLQVTPTAATCGSRVRVFG